MMFEVTFAGAVLAGLLSFLSPCVLPLVPPYLCFLAGVGLDELVGDEAESPQTSGAISRRPSVVRMLALAVIFVAGFSTVFVMLGATATAAGRLLFDYLDVLTKVAGVVIILLGVHFLGLLRIPILYREARFHPTSSPAGFVGAYIIGLAFAFGWTPCVGPILGAILMMAAGEDSVGQGALLLSAYSAGLGIPFIGAALAVGPFMTFMTRFKPFLRRAEQVAGILLIATGILFLTGSMGELAYGLLRLFPALGEIG